MNYSASIRKTKYNTCVCIVKNERGEIVKEFEFPSYGKDRLDIFMAKKWVEILVHYDLI